MEQIFQWVQNLRLRWGRDQDDEKDLWSVSKNKNIIQLSYLMDKVSDTPGKAIATR